MNDIVNFMKILHEIDEDRFYTYLSLLIGVPNKKWLPDSKLEKICKYDFEKHEKILNDFITDDNKNSFKQNWYSSARNYYAKKYLKRIVSNETLMEIYKEVGTKKLYYTVIHLIT